MAQMAISQAISSIAQLREKFNLTPTDNDQFFTEWFQDLPDLTDEEKTSLVGTPRREQSGILGSMKSLAFAGLLQQE